MMRFGFSSQILGSLSVLLIAFLGLLLWIVRTGRKEVSAANRKYMQGQISQGCVEVTKTVVAIANQLQKSLLVPIGQRSRYSATEIPGSDNGTPWVQLRAWTPATLLMFLTDQSSSMRRDSSHSMR
jgi:hypothetical protein